MREKFNNKYVKSGITIFVSGGLLIIAYLILSNIEGFGGVITTIKNICMPFILGLVMAYLLCPIYNLVVKKTYAFLNNKVKNNINRIRIARVIATIISLCFVLGIIGGLIWMLVPELVNSIIGIIKILPSRINELIYLIRDSARLEKHPNMTRYMENALYKAQDYMRTWFNEDFIATFGLYMQKITESVLGTLKALLNFFIGLIVCVYFLNSKEVFKAQSKKLVIATMSEENSKAFIEFCQYTNRTFGGFINGKLIDSLIIGVLCFILMTIIGLPYPLLISTVIGITNIIPFFGPFIGAIPSIILIFFINPMQALYFLIMIFALQQLDGNVIGPKILGGTTGLPSFWVMFAIIVGGGLFGFVGMVIGVPVFAVIHHYVGKLVDKKLRRKGLPSHTTEYQDYNQYGIDMKELVDDAEDDIIDKDQPIEGTKF